MTSLRTNALMAACLAATALLHTAPVQAQSTRDNIRMIEQEYARQSGGRPIPDAQLEYYLARMQEGWPISRVTGDIITSRRTYANSQWRPTSGYVAREVICTSVDNRYRECAIPFRGTAMVSEQLSRTACVEGSTWGQKAGAIWVNRGCRAVFGVVRNDTAGNNGNGMITCTSNQGRYKECATGRRNPVVLVNRLNNSAACVEGRSWGNKAGAVWVKDGCRAQFTTERRAERMGFTRDPNYGVTCASTASGRTICDWDSRYGTPVMTQQLSNAACVQGRGWDYDSNGRIWVDAGCRARFGYGGGGSASTGSWVRDPNYAVTCTSLDGRRTACDWDNRYGNPTLIQQMSSSSCIEGRDWGYDRRGGLWVNSGCRARFGYR